MFLKQLGFHHNKKLLCYFPIGIPNMGLPNFPDIHPVSQENVDINTWRNIINPKEQSMLDNTGVNLYCDAGFISSKLCNG